MKAYVIFAIAIFVTKPLFAQIVIADKCTDALLAKTESDKASGILNHYNDSKRKQELIERYKLMEIEFARATRTQIKDLKKALVSIHREMSSVDLELLKTCRSNLRPDCEKLDAKIEAAANKHMRHRNSKYYNASRITRGTHDTDLALFNVANASTPTHKYENLLPRIDIIADTNLAVAQSRVRLLVVFGNEAIGSSHLYDPGSAVPSLTDIREKGFRIRVMDTYSFQEAAEAFAANTIKLEREILARTILTGALIYAMSFNDCFQTVQNDIQPKISDLQMAVVLPKQTPSKSPDAKPKHTEDDGEAELAL